MSVTPFSYTTWSTGAHEPKTVRIKVLANTTIPARSPIGVVAASGLAGNYNPKSTAGLQNPVYLSAFDIQTGSAAEWFTVYHEGTFNPDLVNWPASTTEAQKLSAFAGSPIVFQAPR